MPECFIPDCHEPGIMEIKDAISNPIKYNGMLLCLSHFKERQYMKENDNFSDNSSDNSPVG